MKGEDDSNLDKMSVAIDTFKKKSKKTNICTLPFDVTAEWSLPWAQKGVE